MGKEIGAPITSVALLKRAIPACAMAKTSNVGIFAAAISDAAVTAGHGRGGETAPLESLLAIQDVLSEWLCPSRRSRDTRVHPAR